MIINKSVCFGQVGLNPKENVVQVLVLQMWAPGRDYSLRCHSLMEAFSWIHLLQCLTLPWQRQEETLSAKAWEV